MWSDEPERTGLVVEWRAVHGVRDDHIGVLEVRIQLGQRKDDAVTVRRVRLNIGGHRGAAQLPALRNSGALQ